MASTYAGPTLDASCAINTLTTFGPNCASDDTVELANIEEVIFSEKSTTLGVPKNPIVGWVDPVAANTNQAAILTWIATANQSTAAMLRRWLVIADKPAPESTSVNMPKGLTYNVGKKHVINITRPLGDHVEYMSLWRKLEAGATYHVWFTTDNALYGGKDGIEAFIQGNIIFADGSPKSFVGTIEWKHNFSPPRDKKPFPSAS
jgi:hypothetical protein